ncbi:type II toxin-antitoxin system VapC family toxin [Nocardioidaceae bacterium SCSIO 66511]|nr:type II toxin-antitoxin system VapC family toxin [Nocardioidaceae bacterium SCSIO 66511]
MAVVDASILAAYYTDDPRRTAAAARLASGGLLFAPAHLDVEVASALRGIAHANPVAAEAASEALRHLRRISIRRLAIAPLLERIWELRHNVTTYDAAYVALAERLSCPLLTCDARLAAAQGVHCDFELIG